MPSLESIIQHDFAEFRNFCIGFLDLDTSKIHAIDENMPDSVTSVDLPYHAALVFSNNGWYQFQWTPEAVENSLARAEEFGHYFNLVLNPAHRTDFLRAEEGSEQYLKLEYRAEYIARLMALIYLRHKGIKETTQVWSNIQKNKIILTTEPLDAKAHYLGYTKAERDFVTMTPQQLKAKLKRILFGNDLSEFKDIYRPDMPKILTPTELIYQLAA